MPTPAANLRQRFIDAGLVVTLTGIKAGDLFFVVSFGEHRPWVLYSGMFPENYSAEWTRKSVIPVLFDGEQEQVTRTFEGLAIAEREADTRLCVKTPNIRSNYRGVFDARSQGAKMARPLTPT